VVSGKAAKEERLRLSGEDAPSLEDVWPTLEERRLAAASYGSKSLKIRTLREFHSSTMFRDRSLDCELSSPTPPAAC
jgi:hypothetical protein